MGDEPQSPGQRLRSLARADFDIDDPASNGWDVLSEVCERLVTEGAVLTFADDMFDLMERLDDADLGSPGPLVHALESTGHTYEPALIASVRRKPSPLSVWMVNRILNSDRTDRAAWLDLLSLAAAHPLASERTRREAEAFSAHQASRHHS